MKSPRAARRVVLFAAIGLSVTLLLAWPIPMAALRWEVIKHPWQGTRLPWRAPSDVSCGVSNSHLALSDWYIVRSVRTQDSNIPLGTPAQVPSWVAFPPAAESHIYQIDTAATGWPLRAFASESWIYTDPALNSGTRSHEVLRHNFVLYSGSSGRIILPLRPIWPGLLADIAIYALAAFLLALAFTSIRGGSRRRRGHCPRCNYDLRATPSGSPCPECGAPFPQSGTRQSTAL